MKFSACALTVSCLIGLHAARAGDPWAKARVILKRHCAPCHGQDGAAKGGFGYALDRDRLIARGKVVPGSAADSELFRSRWTRRPGSRS